jgi:calcium-dependent protein kinase
MAFCYKDIFVGRYYSPFLQDYTILSTLGKGSFATVHLAQHITSGYLRAVKVINKTNSSKSSSKAMDEFQLLKSMDHPNIVKVYGIYEDYGNYYIISEYINKTGI